MNTVRGMRMTTVEVLKTERECVKRNVAGCDRQCEKCDLVLPTEVVLEAYDTAIRELEGDDGK